MQLGFKPHHPIRSGSIHIHPQERQHASPAVQGPIPVQRELPAAHFLLIISAKLKMTAISTAVTTMAGPRIEDGTFQDRDTVTTGTDKAHGSGTALGEHQQDIFSAPLRRHSNAKQDGLAQVVQAAQLLLARSVLQEHSLQKERLAVRSVVHVLLGHTAML